MQSDSLLKNYHHSIFEKTSSKGGRKGRSVRIIAVCRASAKKMN